MFPSDPNKSLKSNKFIHRQTTSCSDLSTFQLFPLIVDESLKRKVWKCKCSLQFESFHFRKYLAETLFHRELFSAKFFLHLTKTFNNQLYLGEKFLADESFVRKIELQTLSTAENFQGFEVVSCSIQKYFVTRNNLK